MYLHYVSCNTWKDIYCKLFKESRPFLSIWCQRHGTTFAFFIIPNSIQRNYEDISLIATRSYGRQNDVNTLVVHVHVYNFQRGIRQPNSISTLKPPGGYFITNAIGIGNERPSWTVFHNLGQSIKTLLESYAVNMYSEGILQRKRT